MAPYRRAGRTALLGPILLLLVLPPGLASAQAPHLAAVENTAMLPTGGGLSPRFYLPAIPALRAPGRDKQRRQGEDEDTREPINCGAGLHNCLDVGSDGFDICCPDDRYCFRNSTLDINCCAIGNVCREQTPCESGYNVCLRSEEVTTTVTPSGADETATPEVLHTFSTFSACCNRPCGTESYQCPSHFGAQCCGYGLRCGTSSACLSEVTTPPPTVAHPVPSGCSHAYQFACDPAEGGGCCASGETCRAPSFCDGEALPTATAPGGNVVVAESGTGLSPGVKAGIGAGVAAGAAAVIALLTWFCVRRRRRGKQGAAGGVPPRRTNNYKTTTLLPESGSSGGGHNNTNNNNNQNSTTVFNLRNRLAGPLSPAANFFHHRDRLGGGALDRDRDRNSEMSGPTSAIGPARPALHQSGLVYDYVGPEAVAGPYTEDTAPAPAERLGGVAVRPDGPNDIMTPVEIGGRSVEPDLGSRGEKVGVVIGGRSMAYGEGEGEGTDKEGDGESGLVGDANAAVAARQDHHPHGPFELVGSPPVGAVSPPLSPTEPGESRLGAFSPSPEPGARWSPEPPESKH
ncbi:hypothetical protein DL764_007218 [Monosporascus ibericus]|uniref:Uncharacterized protein n=1 Tax=Monosporascus ibericus TaxID=155417 RepID=A0A4Q4T634_9PEZI|nr:hypothetical protein DL764_007218 [Monosporascus ibericus]